MQRLLSAKNTVHSKAGSIMAGYMKILPLFLMAWPGIIARIMFPGKILYSHIIIIHLANGVCWDLKPGERILKVTSGNAQREILLFRFQVNILPESSGFRLIFH